MPERSRPQGFRFPSRLGSNTIEETGQPADLDAAQDLRSELCEGANPRTPCRPPMSKHARPTSLKEFQTRNAGSDKYAVAALREELVEPQLADLRAAGFDVDEWRK